MPPRNVVGKPRKWRKLAVPIHFPNERAQVWIRFIFDPKGLCDGISAAILF